MVLLGRVCARGFIGCIDKNKNDDANMRSPLVFTRPRDTSQVLRFTFVFALNSVYTASWHVTGVELYVYVRILTVLFTRTYDAVEALHLMFMFAF